MRATFHARGARRTAGKTLVTALLLPMLMSACAAFQGKSEPPSAEPQVPAVTLLIQPVAIPRIAHRVIPPPPNLWADIRDSFSLDHAVSQRRVRQEVQWLQRHPKYLLHLQDRMQRYLPYIQRQVSDRGLPGELTLLPIVESALDPYAFSRGGAAGLWQFIPGTAKRFGLPRNWWIDGRRDPVLATDAALDYLEELHKHLGDWYLAVAGYNAGEGNVRHALRRARGGDTSFFALHLPRETSTYVPRLLALAAVIDHPAAYGLTLPKVVPDPAFATVDTGGQFDLMKAAKALDMSVDALYEWNPALNQWATPPNGPNRLLVPASKADVAQQRLADVPENQRVQWLRIKIANGDTLSTIAHRYRTDVATLRRVNRLHGNDIRAGHALFIPKSSEALRAYPVAHLQPQGNYRVQRGDSLWSIAHDHGVAVATLVKVNRIGPGEVLQVGRRLTIPGTATVHAPLAARDVVRKVSYGVRRGDSLSTIASKFNVAVRDLAHWNKLDPRKYLQPGQMLLIYVNVVAAD